MKALLSCFLIIFLLLPQATYAQAPPGQEFILKSSNNQLEVRLDKKYGGAITQVYDYAHFGTDNLVDNSQAGAMFQVAFWQYPRHLSVPPTCDPNMSDKWYDNPTQAGFQGDGHAGNPIGIFGTNTSSTDPKEFIQYENSNTTIHFKSRLIRYDYCFTGIGAPLTQSTCDTQAKTYLINPQATCRDLWDTGFYLEQWVSFHPQLPQVLVLKSKLTQEDPTRNTTLITKSLPILFGNHLPRLLYWENGSKKILATGGGGFLPDHYWAALVGGSSENGIGIVGNPNLVSNLPWEPLYSWGSYNTTMATIQTGSHVALETFGQLQNVLKESDDNGEYVYIYNFKQSGNSYSWTQYFPIGDLNLIKTAAEGLATNPNANFNPKITGYVDKFSCTQIQGWAKNDANYTNPLEVQAVIYPTSDYSNTYTQSALANGYRSDLVTICNLGQCTFSINLDSLPPSFSGKKISLNLWGKDGTGEMIIFNEKNNPIGPCPNIETTPSITPLPKPGDTNSNNFVDIIDFLTVVIHFNLSTTLGLIDGDFNNNGKPDIFDLNLLIKSFGK